RWNRNKFDYAAAAVRTRGKFLALFLHMRRCAVKRQAYAATLSSLSAPRMTILSASSGRGRCSAFASSHGARIQTSRSSSVTKITGIAFGWIGSTTAFGAVVRKPYTSCGPGIGFDFVPRSPLNTVQIPAKAARGRSLLSANQTTSFFLVSGLGSGAYSAKLL